QALSEPIISEFVKFYLENAPELVREVGYIPLPGRAYELAQQRVDDRVTGTMFEEGPQVGVSIEDLLQAEKSGETAEAAPAEGAVTDAPAEEDSE
ncbi:MAG: hypothetical protein R3338_02375, partial [Thermoanaerobaculia bacterium]|nr:hypothetical protein [Thermoanaerobaculia bacterium]